MRSTTRKARAIGYIRVSTARQEVGPEVQAHDLTIAAETHGWTLDLRREDAASGKSLAGRPVLAQALADLRAGRADLLAVSKLDRVARSVGDFARLLEDAQREGWGLVCLNLGVDTSTATGKFMAHIMAAVAELEREIISERTREALAQIKADGRRLGRAPTLDPATADRIADLRSLGYSLREIAEDLTASGTPTATGGQWWPATVRAVLLRTRPDLVSDSERPLRSLAEASGQ